MTISGSGVGGNIGGPQQPMHNEIEASAATFYARSMLGIVPDSIDQSFTQMTPRYTTGYLGGFGYKSSAGQPLLDHPLESVRQSLPSMRNEDLSWTSIYKELLTLLPDDLQNQLAQDSNLPLENRNASLVALDNVIAGAATLLSKVQVLSQPFPAGSLEETRTSLNILTPFMALNNALITGKELINASKNFLAEKGANYPHFDGFNNILRQSEEPLSYLQIIKNNATARPNWDLNPSEIALASEAAFQLNALVEKIQNISLGNDLQILNSTLQSLATIAASLSLPNTSSAPLFLALSEAMTGISTNESEIGILGPSFLATTEALNHALIGAILPGNGATAEFFAMLATTSFLTFIGFATLIADKGVGPLPANNNASSLEFFTFELALHLFIHSGLAEHVFTEIIQASTGKNQIDPDIAITLAQTSYLFALLSGSQQGKRSPATLIETEASYLNRAIQSAEKLTQTIQNNQIRLQTTSIALQQARLSLKEQDYENFLDSFVNVLEDLNTSPSKLYQDFKRIADLTSGVDSLLNSESSDQSLNTHIIHII